MTSLWRAISGKRSPVGEPSEARPSGWLPPILQNAESHERDDFHLMDLRLQSPSRSRCGSRARSNQSGQSTTRALSTPSTSTPLSLPPISRSATPHSPWTPARTRMHSFDRAGSETSTVSPNSLYMSMFPSPANQASTPANLGTPHQAGSNMGTPAHRSGPSPHQCARSPVMWTDEFTDRSLRTFMVGKSKNRFASTDPGLCVLFVLYASPLTNYLPIDFESEIDRIVSSARDSGRLQTGQVRLNVGTASSSSLTKLLTLSHAQRSGLILHLAAHGDEDGGLILESTKGTGEVHSCSHEKLRKILNVGGRGLRGVSLVFLSSCKSKKLAQVFIDCGCQHVIATSRTVLDATARAFTERFYGALFVGKSIASAFEHTKEALLASSHPEVADQSNAFLLLTNHDRLECGDCPSAGMGGDGSWQLMEYSDRPSSVLSQRDTDIEGFQEACSFQDKLTFLPPQVEDFFRPPVMQQVLMLLRNRRACALHGPEGIGKTALGVEVARFAASPGRLFSSNVLHVRLDQKSRAVKTIKECVDFFMARSGPCSLAEAPEGHSRCVAWQLQQLERFRSHAPILLVLDDECNALEQSNPLRGLLAEVLRKTHRVTLLLCSRSPLHESLGDTKVVNIELAGLDEQRCASLLLRRVHRPLAPADFLDSENLSEGRTRAQLRQAADVVAKLLVASKVLLPLCGNPGLVRQVGSQIYPGGPPLREVVQDTVPSPPVRDVSKNSLQ
ncbi:unnamed protein product [Symbiodinium natans]|uniref:CHAT domain-containing protein n=1 Tax=Symbiodinium natans TaxID=878477 RepID=A0A812UBL6_9DINO|nr:unnamed protein product [Symbiodinium natans]